MIAAELVIYNFCDWILRMRYSIAMINLNQENAKKAIKNTQEYFPFKNNGLQWDNGLVERLNRTIRDEEIGYRNFKVKDLDKLNSILKEGVRKYNNYRPHHSLGGKTPIEVWNAYYNSTFKHK
jgi:hypothetical protein